MSRVLKVNILVDTKIRVNVYLNTFRLSFVYLALGKAVLLIFYIWS